METIMAVIIPTSFLLLLVTERFLPGRPMPKIKGWVSKSIVFFFVGASVNMTIPAYVSAKLAGRSPFDVRGLGLGLGVMTIVLTSTFLLYWTHRAIHHFDILWRWVHQMHHSAERVDIAGWVIAHPFEWLLNGTMGTLTVALFVVEPSTLLVGSVVTLLLGMFQHVNVRSPQWLGYIVQRPEQHCAHHERGVPTSNFGLPLWDMLFGTFRNPNEWNAKAGFWDGASYRVRDMLLGRDVSQPPAATLERAAHLQDTAVV